MKIKFLENFPLSFPNRIKLVTGLMVVVWAFLGFYLVISIKEDVDEKKEEEFVEEVAPIIESSHERIIDETIKKMDARFYLIPKDFTREQAIQTLEKELIKDGK